MFTISKKTEVSAGLLWNLGSALAPTVFDDLAVSLEENWRKTKEQLGSMFVPFSFFEILGNMFANKNTVSIKIAAQLDKSLIKDIKSALNYTDVIIRTYNKKLFEISISDVKDNLNLNKIMAEIKKFKFNIDEAGFLKSNLDDVFRKITQEK